MKTRNIIMIVVAALVAIAAIILVVVGVTTHTEAGMMRVCWNTTRTADYQAQCETPEEIVWPTNQIPLQVYEPTGSRSVDAAIEAANFQIGCEVLERSDSPSADVQVFLNEPAQVERDRSGGNTLHFLESSGRMRASIATMLIANGAAQTRVIHHELGHVLGLAHDDFESSAMYPRILDTDDLTFFRFTDSDSALLHERFCR